MGGERRKKRSVASRAETGAEGEGEKKKPSTTFLVPGKKRGGSREGKGDYLFKLERERRKSCDNPHLLK